MGILKRCTVVAPLKALSGTPKPSKSQVYMPSLQRKHKERLQHQLKQKNHTPQLEPSTNLSNLDPHTLETHIDSHFSSQPQCPDNASDSDDFDMAQGPSNANDFGNTQEVIEESLTPDQTLYYKHSKTNQIEIDQARWKPQLEGMATAYMDYSYRRLSSLAFNGVVEEGSWQQARAVDFFAAKSFL
ncbi:hypothetical protein V5O48_016758 [Marasmius crinis-equi]|uniref:Uncharacterized protein n=1 Tax=Marasmius crinis-equi TaxID=585013 RepID=A0ABR3EQW6_9AGAR